ncbi:MAG: hypothetical protein ACYC1T_09225, partial [Sulfuricaulis sp.]
DDARARLESGTHPVYHPVRRADAAGLSGVKRKPVYTKLRTPSQAIVFVAVLSREDVRYLSYFTEILPAKSYK